MAHLIEKNDGMALVGKSAWHGLGTVLPEGDWTAADGLTVAGLNWKVMESVGVTGTFVDAAGNAERIATDTHKLLVRSDDRSPLSVVSDGYSVVQNDVLAVMADALGKGGTAKMESAGSLRGGRDVFFLLRGHSVQIGNDRDIIEPYLLLSNTHDGTRSLMVLPTTIRVVCNNTLTAALSGKLAGAFRFRHTSGLKLRTDDIRSALDQWQSGISRQVDACNALSAKTLTTAEIQALWVSVLVKLDGPVAANPADASESRRKAAAVDALCHMAKVFDTERSQIGGPPTAWLAANAATNYVQRERGRMKSDSDADIASRLFGVRAEETRLCMEAALALV